MKEEKKGFEWINITNEISQCIGKYENKQDELIKIINEIKAQNNLDEEKIDRDNIDPFSILNVLFIRCADKNRNKLINDFANVNELNLKLSENDFTMKGIPNLNYSQLRVTKGAENEKKLINSLWNLYKYALKYNKSTEENFIKYYNNSVKEYKKANNKEKVSQHFFKQITVSLYIMKPNFFIPLDKNTIKELENMKLIKDTNVNNFCINGENYLKLCKGLSSKLKKENNYSYQTLYELSHYAYEKYKKNSKGETMEDIINEFNENYKKNNEKYYKNEKNMNDAINKNSKEIFKNVLDGLYSRKARGTQYVSKIKNDLDNIFPKLSNILKNADAEDDIYKLYDKLKNFNNIGDKIASELLMYLNKDKFAFYDENYVDVFNSLYEDNKIENKGKNYKEYCEKMQLLFDLFKKNEIKEPNFFMCNTFLSLLESNEQYKNIVSEYIKSKNKESNYNESNEVQNLNTYSSSNYIFYGAPGCGKSYYVKKLIEKVDEDHYERILFHPEYTYSDFIGQILPDKKGNDITYKFKPGPFTRILGEALKNDKEEYYLDIEEINRGNAPAIFGDVFQLLDRDESGGSEYKITNKDISDCLNEDYGLDCRKIYIPKNLTIYATMNLNDQNVFTLDTAFKRRWNMIYIPINFDNTDDKIGDVKIEFLGNITWREFVESLNAVIPDLNNGLNGDDKLIGQHFLAKKEMNNKELFADKILQYLWNDVAKTDRSSLFSERYKNFNDLINDFCKEDVGLKVFREGIFPENNIESENNND